MCPFCGEGCHCSLVGGGGLPVCQPPDLVHSLVNGWVLWFLGAVQRGVQLARGLVSIHPLVRLSPP